MTDKKAMSKTEVISALANGTGLSKKQVNEFFDELVKLIGDNLSEDGPGVFNIPGMMKVRVVRKPATPERTGINPFTKQEQVFAAKPARNVVKVSPLKRLKDVV